MNRPIKFRAWDEVRKVMRYRWLNIVPDSKYARVWGDHDDDLEGANNEVAHYINETLLMQFTGLHDKNGKEIFQGDLLRVEADPEGYGSCSYGGIVEVTAETCGYSLKPIKPTFEQLEAEGKPWDSTSMWHVCEEHSVTGEGTTEVIGNRFENPELLTDKSV